MRRSSFRDSSFVVRRSSFVVSRSSFVVRRSSFFSRQLLIVRSSVVDHKQKHTAFSPTLFSRGSFSPRFSCRPPTQVRLGPFISDMMRWHSHQYSKNYRKKLKKKLFFESIRISNHSVDPMMIMDHHHHHQKNVN